MRSFIRLRDGSPIACSSAARPGRKKLVNRIAWALLVLFHYAMSANAQANFVPGQALSADGCVLHYTTDLPRIERFNICSGQTLSDFNQTPLPDSRGAK